MLTARTRRKNEYHTVLLSYFTENTSNFLYKDHLVNFYGINRRLGREPEETRKCTVTDIENYSSTYRYLQLSCRVLVNSHNKIK
jgi:hypothetical protein